MGYDGIEPENLLTLSRIYSVHYFEYMSDFCFSGEAHDFWEFLFVDKGEVEVTAGSSVLLLKKGDMIFHEPGEFHSLRATGEIAPNLVVISFDCRDSAMELFRKRICRPDTAGRNLLAKIISEAVSFFNCRLDDPYLQNMPVKPDAVAGSGQLIRLYLELFLIHMFRRFSDSPALSVFPTVSDTVGVPKERNDKEIFVQVSAYLNDRINTTVTIEQICKDNMVCRSRLQTIFKKHSAMGIIEFFSKRKIDAAKEMIRTDQMNFTQISEKLGYSSIHYFSRKFKKVSGMTPSEYASSIKAMASGSFN